MSQTGCIDGMLVIEIADGWSAGAVAGRLLSELGARVIKIEPPQGDRLRRLGPGRDASSSATFRNLNTNKESIVLNLNGPDGMEIPTVSLLEEKQLTAERQHSCFVGCDVATAGDS